ncbi:U3 small nucleolar RNA-associated protein 4 homolog [Tetranychus urticae]|uniref:WD repeat-containing protein 55 homolog n=1 Tax=Tetranychus urticae TaxID=32264 RepID=T1KBL3_TETUR|nr:U3 small nucleolar RNA-associated protein 4 homolog [Tetranychus urticae]
MPVKMSNRFISHRINLFEPDLLFSINCLSLNSKENKLAVLRRSLPKDDVLQSKSSTANIDSLLSHSAIEIWQSSVDHCLTLSQVIYEDEDDPCLLESLGWSYDNRLWACGLNGRLHKVDLVNGTINTGFPLVSGAGWCLQFNGDRTLAAVGTETGYINIFNFAMAEQEVMDFEFVKTLDRDQARIMCISWYEPDNEDKRIVSGSVGVIKIWNYESGSCLNVIKASAATTIFWCLTIIDGFTIVSGDSTGNTSFWDGKNAILINSIPSHKSDVLCLTKTQKNLKNLIYSSGIDPSVITFNVDSNGKGVQSATLHLHSHDVRSLVFTKEWLISGGFDCYLTQVCAFPPKQVHQAPVLTNMIHIHKDHMLFQYSRSLELWKIGSTTPNNNANNNYQNEILALGDASQLPLTKEPVKIVNISTKRLIHQSNFSGPWIVYSILEKVKVLHCSGDTITKVPLLCDPIFEVITGLQFVDDKYLLLSTGLKIYVFKLAISGLVLVTQFKHKHRIVKMATSSDYVALSLENRSVVINNTADWSRVVRFKANSIPTCFTFNIHQKDHLWLGFSNHLIMSYSIPKNEFTKYSYNEPNQYLPLIGLTFHPNGFIAYDQDRLYHYNGSSWTSSDRYSHLAKVEYLPENQELLVIEVTSSMIKRKLPIRFSKKKFGT